jgi:hypothetical protein
MDPNHPGQPGGGWPPHTPQNPPPHAPPQGGETPQPGAPQPGGHGAQGGFSHPAGPQHPGGNPQHGGPQQPGGWQNPQQAGGWQQPPTGPQQPGGYQQQPGGYQQPHHGGHQPHAGQQPQGAYPPQGGHQAHGGQGGHQAHGGPQQGYGQQGGYAPPPQPPKKGGGKWWLIGCLGCGGLAVVAFFALGAIGWMAERNASGTGADSVSVDTAATEATTKWENAPSRLHAELAPHYVPFTLHYPSSWTVTADGSTAGDPNFFKAEIATPDGTTMENFAVGYWTGDGAAEGRPELLTGVLSFLEGQLQNSFGGFERVSEETTKVDGRWGKGFRFRGHISNGADTVPLWGRLLVVPTGTPNGAVLLMLATPHAKGLTGPDDVGERGGSAVILRSIRFGGADAIPAAPATDDDAAAAPDPAADAALAARADAALREFDGNGDGWLSGTELTACECAGLDADSDGRVTAQEVAAGFAAAEAEGT